MKDQQIFLAFCYVATVVFAIMRLSDYLKMSNKSANEREEKRQIASVLKTPEELQARRNELLVLTASFLHIKPELLQLETRFERDLKVPAVELLNLLEEIEIRFGHEAGSRKIVTFGELLDLAQLHVEPLTATNTAD